MFVPLARPFVVLGEGVGSYCLFRSQYCVYEPLQKSGQRPCSVHEFGGSSWPFDSRPVYVDQNCVLRNKPPYVSAQQESTDSGLALLEQEKMELESAVGQESLVECSSSRCVHIALLTQLTGMVDIALVIQRCGHGGCEHGGSNTQTHLGCFTGRRLLET